MYFFRLIVCVSLFSVVYIIIGIMATVIYIEDLGYKIWIYCNLLLIVLLLMLDFNLVLFHLWLRSKNLTTYEYIMGKKNSK